MNTPSTPPPESAPADVVLEWTALIAKAAALGVLDTSTNPHPGHRAATTHHITSPTERSTR